MSRIEFKPPEADTPGYLRRQRSALYLFEKFKGNPTPLVIDELISFLLPFVVEPQDREAAREALLDATEEQFKQLLELVTGGAEELPLAERSKASSDSTSGESLPDLPSGP